MRLKPKFRTALAAAVLLLVFAIPFEAQRAVTGTWVWAGARGWQRITLELTASGSRVTGSIILGPGSRVSNAPDWEYFFEPAVYPITNGVVNGDTITFEQVLRLLTPSSPTRGVPVNTEQATTTGTTVLKYSGHVQGDSLIITRETPSRPNDPFSLGSHRFRFVAQRSNSTAPRVSVGESQLQTATAAGPLGVSLDVEVLDGTGVPVLSLTKDDFVIREDGTVRPILNVVLPATPLNVLMMFDHNLTWLKDSKEGAAVDVRRAWERLFQSSLIFLGRLRPQDRYAMGVFEEGVKPVLDWRGVQDRRAAAYLGDVIQPPRGQKDVYGMVRWAATRFDTVKGRKSVIIFTDGRDGRLSPTWFRDSRQREVLDPLFGLVDEGEALEFAETLGAVKQSGVKLHFIVINSDHDPEFGPSVVGRRISGLYPGSNEGIRDYLSGVRSRLKQLAEGSGGRVLYGNTPEDAPLLYRDLHVELGVGKTYTLEFLSGKPADGSFRRLEASVPNKAFRLTQYQEGYIAQ